MRHGPLVLNERAAARLTLSGVERWSREVGERLLALDPELYLPLAPPQSLGGRLGQAWEQLGLPLAAARIRAQLILSPANLAPLAWPRNVVVVHDAAPLRLPDAYSSAYRRWHQLVGVAAARRALRVLTVSRFSRGELVELMGLDPQRVEVVGAGVSERFFSVSDIAATRSRYGLDRPYVLTVGTADRRKNLSVLACAARGLKATGRQLVWVGGGRSHIRGESPGPAARALGYVPDDDLPGLYAGAEAFVLPSLYEGFGLPCLEAMASGTPVVASNHGALAEICGTAALAVDPRDGDAVSEAVMRVVEDSDLRERLRLDGLERARLFTWERVASRVDMTLRAIAQSASGRNSSN